MSALEAAKMALKKQEAWLNYIRQQGYRVGMRPAAWIVTPYEQNFLTTIDRYLNDRRAVWKFKEKGKK